MTTEYRTRKPANTVHCEMCGAGVDRNQCPDGYTPCCDELICAGGPCVVVLATYPDGNWETIHFHDTEDAEYYMNGEDD